MENILKPEFKLFLKICQIKMAFREIFYTIYTSKFGNPARNPANDAHVFLKPPSLDTRWRWQNAALRDQMGGFLASSPRSPAPTTAGPL